MSSTIPAPMKPAAGDSAGHIVAPFVAKDASHKAFYAGFFKGMFSAYDGMILFASSAPLRQIFWRLLNPLRNAQLAYAAVAMFIFLLVRDPADDLAELFWTISRWSRMITVVTSFLLEKHFKANSAMFFEALKVLNPEFAESLQQHPKTGMSIRDGARKAMRLTKLGLFKFAGKIIHTFIPGGKYVAMPAVKFVSMRPVLGAPAAAGMAAIHILPSEILESTRFDDAFVSVGEAIIDADGFGTDSVKEFATRLPNDEVRAYFAQRYRGYVTGYGFVYSLLQAIPFLGIPMALISECGAACVVADIVKRNMEKPNRIPLTCEEAFNDKTS